MHQSLLGRTKKVQTTALPLNCNNGTQLCSTSSSELRNVGNVAICLYSLNFSPLWSGLKRYVSYFYQVLKRQSFYNHTPAYFSPWWVVCFHFIWEGGCHWIVTAGLLRLRTRLPRSRTRLIRICIRLIRICTRLIRCCTRLSRLRIRLIICANIWRFARFLVPLQPEMSP